MQQLQKYEGQTGKAGGVSAVDLQLLIGKVYSQWDRHFASALAVYDGIIEKYPEDFRWVKAFDTIRYARMALSDAQYAS